MKKKNTPLEPTESEKKKILAGLDTLAQLAIRVDECATLLRRATELYQERAIELAALTGKFAIPPKSFFSRLFSR